MDHILDTYLQYFDLELLYLATMFFHLDNFLHRFVHMVLHCLLALKYVLKRFCNQICI